MKADVLTITVSLTGEEISREYTGTKKVRRSDYYEAQVLMLTGKSSGDIISAYREEHGI